MSIYARRRLVNGSIMGLSVAATAFGLLWLVLVLWTLLVERHQRDRPRHCSPR